MKKTLAILMAAGLLLCACQPDDPIVPTPDTTIPVPDPQPAFSLAETAWQAVEQGILYHDSVPDGVPVTVLWTLDFWEDGMGSLTIRIEFDGTDQSSQQSSVMYWTYDPESQTGNIRLGNITKTFTYLPDDNMIEMELHITVYGGNRSSTFGGNLHFLPLENGQ